MSRFGLKILESLFYVCIKIKIKIKHELIRFLTLAFEEKYQIIIYILKGTNDMKLVPKVSINKLSTLLAHVVQTVH